jgi:HD domain
MTTRPLTSAADALALLQELGAPPRLVRHHELVVEAAQMLLAGIRSALPASVDQTEVLIGAALHDVGKTKHSSEMNAPGSAHELDGEALLLAAGVAPRLARFSRTHARWTEPGVTLEDLLVSAADKLWRGKREPELEQLLISSLAQANGAQPWAMFERLDSVFEAVAAQGDDRLSRS